MLYLILGLLPPFVEKLFAEFRVAFNEIPEEKEVKLGNDAFVVEFVIEEDDAGNKFDEKSVDVELFIDAFAVFGQGNKLQVRVSKPSESVHQQIKYVSVFLVEALDHAL